MNRYLLVFMGLLALEIALCTMQKYLFLSNLGNVLHLNLHVVTSNNFSVYRLDSDGAYYLGEKEDISLVGVLADLSSFLIIFSYIVPISLYTTLGKLHIDLLPCSDN